MDPITNSPEQVPTDAGPFGEQAWIEVIEKMDEVYNDLLQYEVALEEKNAALEESQQFIESVLASMSDILIVCDRNALIVEVNPSLCRLVGKKCRGARPPAAVRPLCRRCRARAGAPDLQQSRSRRRRRQRVLPARRRRV